MFNVNEILLPRFSIRHLKTLKDELCKLHGYKSLFVNELQSIEKYSSFSKRIGHFHTLWRTKNI
jgi:hypothetical protein